MEKTARMWDTWVEEAVEKLQKLKLLRSLRPINVLTQNLDSQCATNRDDALQVFDGLRRWDRDSIEVEISESTFQEWLNDIPSCGVSVLPSSEDEAASCSQHYRKLLLFSGNDYLGLSSHPTIRMAAAKAVEENGMGPRGSALICGYTDYHRLLETCLADLKKKEDCLLCPTGFSANLAVMVALGSVASLLASGQIPNKSEKVAIFSDALNHASIIDGLRLAERLRCAEVFVYRHCDMSHLNELLYVSLLLLHHPSLSTHYQLVWRSSHSNLCLNRSDSVISKKVVVTDSLFSMDGDFAPMFELVKLRKRHGFLLVIDDAHGTFVCGKEGSGVAEEFNCESGIDICIGTLSKAAGCHGGFIACSKHLKQLILSRGRSFIFSTSMPVPFVAAAHASVIVARKETWRRRAIWERVQDFRNITGIPITSHIVSLVIGSEEKALGASRHMLKSGFHVTAIRPPTVPPNSCRLRVTLCAAHTRADVQKLAVALSQCINLDEINVNNSNVLQARL